MEQLKFVNKMWISSKPRIWECILVILIGIYCVLQTFLFIMDGIEVRSCVYLILAIFAFLWYKKSLKRKGKYVENDCILRFTTGQLEWEYPHLEIEGSKRKMNVLYTITRDDIKDIAISHELKSIRIVSKPVMSVVKGEKEKITDFHKKKKDSVLVLYYPKIDEVGLLIKKYLKDDIKVID